MAATGVQNLASTDYPYVTADEPCFLGNCVNQLPGSELTHIAMVPLFWSTHANICDSIFEI